MKGLASESITKNDYFQNAMAQMFFPPGLAKNADSGTALIQIPNIHVPNPVHKKILPSLSIRIFTIFGYKLCYVQDLHQIGVSQISIPSGTKLTQKLMTEKIT